MEYLRYEDIRPINTDCLLVSKFRSLHTSAGTPLCIELSCSLSRKKAKCKSCEFKVYVPAETMFDSADHIQLKQAFESGEYFATVRPVNLRIYRKIDGEIQGDADSFVFVDPQTYAQEMMAPKKGDK